MNIGGAKARGRVQGLLAHIRRAERLKLPLAQYCRARDLDVQSMYNLRSRLAISKSRQQAVPKMGRPTEPFIAVQVAVPMMPTAAACRLLVKGWVIECAGLPSLRSHCAWVADRYTPKLIHQ